MRVRFPIPLAAVSLVAVVALVAVATANGPHSPDAMPAPSGSPTVIQSLASIVSASPTAPAEPETPTPTADPTLEPLPSVAPSADDVLELAGRDGVPGLLSCGANFAFSFASLDNPTGAEDLVGPEYDALRGFLSADTALLGPDPGPDPKAREVARYDGRVAFLLDRFDPGPWGENGGPYLYVYFNRAGETWKWAGSGDCQPRAFGPAGYSGATWMLDPSFRRPRPSDRVLHILVSEHECASAQSASARIGPGFVITDPYEVHVEIVVERLLGIQDCQAAPPTSATVRLPEPLGNRTLRDTNAHLRWGTSG